jgi:hypothetical protein
MYAMALILAMGLGGAVRYHPNATHHYLCMARPGTAAALYCPAPAAPIHHHHRH